MKLTVQNFAAFVMKQPPGKGIDHSKSWCECAAGDYAQVELGRPAMECFDELVVFSEALKRVFPCIAETNPSKNPYPTYGHIQIYLAKMAFEEYL